MPQTEFPTEIIESSYPSPVPSNVESLVSESPSPSEISSTSDLSSDSFLNSYTLVAPGYEKIKIPLEPNLKQLLVRVAGTYDLENVTKIRLRVIARDFSIQRLPIYMPNLTELNLDGSALLSLRDLGCDMTNLTILHVTRCGLNSLDGLFGLQTLVELYAGYNNIDDLSPCAFLPDIEKIDLRNNRIQDVTSVSFLSLCETLQHISLEGNPTAEIKNYRHIIKDTLPNLISLDDIELTSEDRSIEDDNMGTVIDEKFYMNYNRLPPIFNDKGTNLKFSRPTNKQRPCSSQEKSSSVNLVPISTRPSTARKATASDFAGMIEGSDLKLQDVYKLVVPSLLTTGKPLCGSPAMALRDWKKFGRVQAWGESSK